jgi:hypothetical protein
VKDPTKHVCEIQVAMRKMVFCRDGFHGHDVYGRVRNAWELLNWVGVCGDDYPEERKKGLNTLGHSITQLEQLVRLGVDCVELVSAIAAPGKKEEVMAVLRMSEEKNLETLLKKMEQQAEARQPSDGDSEIDKDEKSKMLSKLKKERNKLIVACKDAGFTVTELTSVGCSKLDLYQAWQGCSSKELETAGFKEDDIKLIEEIHTSGDAGNMGKVRRS